MAYLLRDKLFETRQRDETILVPSLVIWKFAKSWLTTIKLRILTRPQNINVIFVSKNTTQKVTLSDMAEEFMKKLRITNVTFASKNSSQNVTFASM